MSTLDELWIEYRAAEGRGVRAEYLRALREFISAWQTAPATTRARWLTSYFEAGIIDSDRVRTLLLEEVLLPELVARARAGHECARRRTATLLERRPHERAWGAYHELGWRGLVDELLAASPGDEGLRRAALEQDLDYLRYTLHELPSGVLYGHDGASVAECDELLAWLDELEGSMRTLERAEYRPLIAEARRHYAAYRAYLGAGRVEGGYTAYLARAGLDDPARE